MPQVFDVDSTSWHNEQIRLSEMLSDEEHRSARATTINAHYTAPVVIRAMYDAAQRFGFQGGRILEPACGIGHFIGLMPEAMLKESNVTAIEIDPLTARIASALYPDADIRQQPFEKSKLPDESFDLAISTVPFGDYTVHDPHWNEFKFPIHDYFFAAALDKVRPGGLLCSSRPGTRWIKWIQHCVKRSPKKLNSSVPSGCPTPRSRKTPARK